MLLPTAVVDAGQRRSTLQSIRSYFASDDDFNWNYGLALAATGKYREAEEALGAVQSDKYRWAAPAGTSGLEGLIVLGPAGFGVAGVCVQSDKYRWEAPVQSPDGASTCSV